MDVLLNARSHPCFRFFFSTWASFKTTTKNNSPSRMLHSVACCFVGFHTVSLTECALTERPVTVNITSVTGVDDQNVHKKIWEMYLLWAVTACWTKEWQKPQRHLTFLLTLLLLHLDLFPFANICRRTARNHASMQPPSPPPPPPPSTPLQKWKHCWEPLDAIYRLKFWTPLPAEAVWKVCYSCVESCRWKMIQLVNARCRICKHVFFFNDEKPTWPTHRHHDVLVRSSTHWSHAFSPSCMWRCFVVVFFSERVCELLPDQTDDSSKTTGVISSVRFWRRILFLRVLCEWAASYNHSSSPNVT